MSKNKFFKKLLIGGLCALTATAMIGATACQPGDNGDDGDDNGIHQTNEHTISFNLDGGSWSKADGYTVKVDNNGTLSASDIETPTKDGYEFAGWFNGSTAFVLGTTKVTGNITLTAKWTEHVAADLVSKQWLATSGTVGANVEANAEIASNELFSASVGFASAYTATTKPANAAFTLLDGESKQFASGLNSTAEFKTNTNSGTITFEAKADITLYAYVAIADSVYNGSRSGYVYYSVSGSDGAVMSAKTITALSDAATTVKVDLKESDTLTIYAYNTNSSGARLWLFGAEAIENNNPVTVNYYYGEQLIYRELVEDGATLTKPSDPVYGENKFLGWYADSACETEYTFGELAAGTTSVNVYADFQVSDVTIEYYLDKEAETPWKTVNAFSGHYAEEVTADMKADGSPFLGWVTEDDQDFDYKTTELVAGTLKLYAKYGSAPTVGVEGTYTYTVSGSEPVCEASEGASTTAESLATFGTSYNASDFKFDGNDKSITLKIYVEAGTTVTLNLTGYTGSSGNASGLTVTKGENDPITTEDSTTIEFSADSKAAAQESGTIVFTATDDGLVTLTITRSVAKTARLVTLEVVVAKAE